MLGDALYVVARFPGEHSVGLQPAFDVPAIESAAMHAERLHGLTFLHQAVDGIG